MLAVHTTNFSNFTVSMVIKMITYTAFSISNASSMLTFTEPAVALAEEASIIDSTFWGTLSSLYLLFVTFTFSGFPNFVVAFFVVFCTTFDVQKAASRKSRAYAQYFIQNRDSLYPPLLNSLLRVTLNTQGY